MLDIKITRTTAPKAKPDAVSYTHLDVYKRQGEVARDAIDKNAFYPFLDDLTNQAKIPPFPRPPMLPGERCGVSKMDVRIN